MICKSCGAVARPGELSCIACGTLFYNPLRTRRVAESAEAPVWVPTGELLLPDERAIILYARGVAFPLPAEAITVLGRGDADINLADVGGLDDGVSRRHAQIRRENLLFYLSDLGSTNGTYLNGLRVPPGTERVLRDGDAIRLGHFKMRLSLS